MVQVIDPQTGLFAGSFLFLLIVVTLWSAVWKGFALWKSARNSQLYWFIAMLIINTAGLLEIMYLLFFQGKKRIIVAKKR